MYSPTDLYKLFLPVLRVVAAVGLTLLPLSTAVALDAQDPAVAATDPGSLLFSDPANGLPAPAWAVGQANRSPDLDILPGFQKPPAGFGAVPFFWWLGDPLTKERLGWILGQMKGYGISGYQINYAHGFHDGGRSCGLTQPSDPTLFSEEWWKLVGWFMQEAKKQGAGISLSDYTLGIGQGWVMDEILNQHPEMAGSVLKMVDGKAEGALTTREITGEGGQKRVVSVVAVANPISIDPMNLKSGEVYADKFFGQFEKRFPGEGGKGLNFFFSDELKFEVKGTLWNDRFAAEFKRMKGYDIVPELPALFADLGPRTPKIRLDYSDVMVALTEEGFFKPVYNWHQRRGMTMGCDHGGRGMKVVEFGDYFRTQRWNQGPGADQPALGKQLIKTKVASSMAHLYQRPRVWLEGYYGSGWGTSSAEVVDATFADFTMGYNLLSFHGMYYATHGGWWEWAPPDNTFRMPYWHHMKGFMECTQRLSYILTQGTHACDVAILYPVAPMEAGQEGKEAVAAAFRLGQKLYAKSIDFDFMDFQSLDRAMIAGKELQVSGESYKILILPAMVAIRQSTIKKALEFKKAGGIVLAVGALPRTSDRVGMEDPELDAMVKELFPEGVAADAVQSVTASLPIRDYDGPGYIQHRKLGRRNLYAIYNAPKDTEVAFRSSGKAELWNPWTGTISPLPVVSQADGITKLKLPLTDKEIQLVVFSQGTPEMAKTAPRENPPQVLKVEGDWEFELQPTSDNRFGDFHWPPTQELIGAEARQVWYCEGDKPSEPWRKVTMLFGPRFLKYEEMPDPAALTPLKGGVPCEFSWSRGIENDPGVQGFHGLKEKMRDETLAIGTKKAQSSNSACSYAPGKSDSFFWTTVAAPQDMTANIHTGQIKPVKAWLNGAEIDGKAVHLKAGANPLVLQFAKDKPGLTYFVVSTSEPTAPAPVWIRHPAGEQPVFKLSPLASKWADDKGLLPFDVRPDEKSPVGWYRFVSPPGLRAITVPAQGSVQVLIDNKPLEKTATGGFKLALPLNEPATVLVRIEQTRGSYGGAALLGPIKLDCGAGSFPLGDWSKNECLASYSGGAWYRKTVSIPAGKSVTLDLGNLTASAEVKVNGKPVGIRVSPPWTFDISEFVKPGENRIEVLVCNTLANHYSTVPTRYRGSPISGLLGPVRVVVAE